MWDRETGVGERGYRCGRERQGWERDREIGVCEREDTDERDRGERDRSVRERERQE